MAPAGCGGVKLVTPSKFVVQTLKLIGVLSLFQIFEDENAAVHLVEGGADTVSRFVAARCLDRLHVVVAPIILGWGRPSLTLPLIERVEEAVQARMRVHVDRDIVLEEFLRRHQPGIGPVRLRGGRGQGDRTWRRWSVHEDRRRSARRRG